MVEPDEPQASRSDEPPPPTGAARRRWPWPVRWLFSAIGGLFFLLAAIGFGVDTNAGHRFIVDRIAEMKPASGLRIHIGRIDGSIWRHARIKDLRLSDPAGVFLEAPTVQLDWQPGRWFANRLHVDRLTSDLVIIRRLPKLRPSPPGTPIIPNYRVHIGTLDLRLRLEPGVAGPERRLARLVGQADTGNGRAVVGLKARSSANDHLVLALDTEPDRNIFDLDARLLSPAGGVVPGLLGSKKPVEMVVTGSGRWAGWKGTGRLTVGGVRIVDLALHQAHNHYALAGTLHLQTITQGKIQRLTAPSIRIVGHAVYQDRRIRGELKLASPSVALVATGGVDLAKNRFDPLTIEAALLQPSMLFPNMSGRDVRVHLDLTGPLRTPAFRYTLSSPHFAFDQTGFDDVRASGSGRFDSSVLSLPISLTARRVTGLGPEAGGILADLTVKGVLKLTPKMLTGDRLSLSSDKLKGTLALLVDLVSGHFSINVSGGLERYLIPGLGIVDVLTDLKVLPTPDLKGSVVSGHGRVWVRRFDNVFLRGLAGGLPTLETELVREPNGVLDFTKLKLIAPTITIEGAGTRQRDGSIQFQGEGTQTAYGPFKLGLDGQIDHPKIALVLDHPVDGLSLSAVHLNLDPTPQGFALKVSGGSVLGPFGGVGAVLTGPGQPVTVIRVDALSVTDTIAKGLLRADSTAMSGQIALAGGGIDGTLDFSPVGSVQRLIAHIAADHANLAGDFGVAVRRGRVDADLLFDRDGTKVDATLAAQGLRRGALSLARLTANAKLARGTGEMHASIAGSRGKAFAFETDTVIAPDKYVVRGAGQIDGKSVTLATPAVLRHQGQSWMLARTSLGFAGGSAAVAGRFDATGSTLDAGLDAMPLSVLDIFRPGLGLGGAATGQFTYSSGVSGQLPTIRTDLRIRALTRAGLVLSSKPVDLGLAATLQNGKAALRAIAASGGQVIGRAQIRLFPIGAGDNLADRLLGAPLFGQLRYNGPADTLWRLGGIETIDLSGPVAIGADIGGTLRAPQIRGSMATAAGRLESATIGTVIDKIRARGLFDGSRLLIDQFAGTTKDNGTLSGRAVFDFAGAHGLGMDIALSANHATLLARDDIGATVTGPLSIKSDGRGGSISGNVKLDRSSYRFGKAAAQQIPHLDVRELNAPMDEVDAPVVLPWTLNLTLNAHNQLFVRGLGLDSEWRAQLVVKGQLDNPAIAGRADLIRGNYEFAGRRFDLDRGIIRFSNAVPVDPALDIVAKANIQSVNASIHVSGTGSKPEINFTSTPALPEDELLSRLLFGTSIANLSAPEALQLATAVNGLRTGGRGSLDPINAVRRIAGLDRLRIEPADVTTGQKTSIAAGKYIGKRTYVELVTDGQGYSATRLEFQVTRWLSLLSTISTIGRQSANVRISKDY